MINIVFERDDKYRSMRIQVKGHSNSGEKGTDILCAAVSTLIYSTVFAVDALEDKGAVNDKLVTLESGRADIAFGCVDNDAQDMAMLMLYPILCTFKALAEQHGAYISYMNVSPERA